MNAFGRGWRRFRRLPLPAQAAAWLALAAVYTVGLVVLIGGGDDAAPGERQQQARPEPLSPLERQVKTAIDDVDVKVAEQYDVERFRKPIVRSVDCPQDDKCKVVYALGLPGRGRILEDQRPMVERIYRRTPVRRLTLQAVRDVSAAGVPAKSSEETPSGAPLLTTECDASRRKDVDWSKRSGPQILQNICRVGYFDQGEIHRQEPVAPDDPAAQGAEIPEPSG